jgi:hypothetical protein
LSDGEIDGSGYGYVVRSAQKAAWGHTILAAASSCTCKSPPGLVPPPPLSRLPRRCSSASPSPIRPSDRSAPKHLLYTGLRVSLSEHLTAAPPSDPAPPHPRHPLPSAPIRLWMHLSWCSHVPKRYHLQPEHRELEHRQRDEHGERTRFFLHRLRVWRVGRALMSPALLLPRRMARPCSHSHSLPVGAFASILWRTVRLLPHRRAHGAVCTAHPWCGVHGMRALLACSRLAAPDAATGRLLNLHGALACRRRVRP